MHYFFLSLTEFLMQYFTLFILDVLFIKGSESCMLIYDITLKEVNENIIFLKFNQHLIFTCDCQLYFIKNAHLFFFKEF